MPRAFDITAVTDSVRLDAAGQGEFAFTVSNALRAPVRARASVVADAGAKAEWTSISGGEERDFPPDGTQQFTVKLRVPPGTPPGRYTFHLLVVDVTNPDESYAEGPACAFEVVAAAAPPQKKFPWWIIAAAVGAVVIIGTVIGIIASRGGAELGQPCPDNDCEKGLTCSGADGGVCLVSKGESCDGGSGCVTGFCKSGRCDLALGETCQTEAQCPGPLKCTDVLGSKLCLLDPQEKCDSDRDCSSFFCRSGKCNRDDGRCDSNDECRTPSVCGPSKLCQFPNGQVCSGAQYCLSGFCAGTCQPAPLGFQCPAGCPVFSTCMNGTCVRIGNFQINQQVLKASPQMQLQMQQLQNQ